MRVLVDGLLYDGGEVERVVVGTDRVNELPTLLSQHPAISNSTNGIKIDAQDGRRLSRYRRFSRPKSVDNATLEQARKLEPRFKKDHVADEADFVTLAPAEFIAAVEAQRDQLLSLPIRQAPEAFRLWIRRAADAVLARFKDKTVVILKGRVLPYPPQVDGKYFLPLDQPSVDVALAQLLALNPED